MGRNRNSAGADTAAHCQRPARTHGVPWWRRNRRAWAAAALCNRVWSSNGLLHRQPLNLIHDRARGHFRTSLRRMRFSLHEFCRSTTLTGAQRALYSGNSNNRPHWAYGTRRLAHSALSSTVCTSKPKQPCDDFLGRCWWPGLNVSGASQRILPAVKVRHAKLRCAVRA